MHSHEVLGRQHLIVSIMREEKAARESKNGEARSDHLRLADLYRRRFCVGKPAAGDEGSDPLS